MQSTLEILKYTLPGLVVLITAAVMMRFYHRSITAVLHREVYIQDRKITIPLRLQAYERLSLFLERITVDSLVVREQSSEFSCKDFHQHLLAVVRQEFEHNLSQQIYVSGDAWTVIRNAKEGTIKMINTAAYSVNPDGPALLLSKKIIEIQMESEASPPQIALEFLRKEARKLFEMD